MKWPDCVCKSDLPILGDPEFLSTQPEKKAVFLLVNHVEERRGIGDCYRMAGKHEKALDYFKEPGALEGVGERERMWHENNRDVVLSQLIQECKGRLKAR